MNKNKFNTGDLVETTRMIYNIRLLVRYDDYDIPEDNDMIELIDTEGTNYLFKRKDLKKIITKTQKEKEYNYPDW